MKTASLYNALYDDARPPTPVVGMGATILMWTDRHAATILAIGPNARWLTVQEDRAIRTDGNGMSDAQTYRYERNPDAPIWRFTLRKDGRYRRTGDSSTSGLSLLIGVRRTYHDFSF